MYRYGKPVYLQSLRSLPLPRPSIRGLTILEGLKRSQLRSFSDRQKPLKPFEPKGLTHVDEQGAASMVDVGSKAVTKRKATAIGTIRFSNAEVAGLINANSLKKGDVLGVARVAGIMGVKQTSNLIPLCHPLQITKIKNNLKVDSAKNAVNVSCTVECEGKTGVEMEALMGATLTLNTIYDMCKAVDRHMVLEGIQVVEKEGGKHDFTLDR